MNKFTLSMLSVAVCLAISPLAIGAVMSKSDYKAAKEGISAKFKADQAACAAMTGNVKDICSEEAKGRERVATAELVATNEPTSKHRYDVRLAKANATYAVAIEKCDDLSGNDKDVCVKEAKAALVSGKADAKLASRTAEANTIAREKTADANTVARAKTVDARKDAEAEKRDAAYAVAKEKCDAFADDVKTNCLKDAKIRYGQS
jgi:hypothetical protein